MYIKSVFLSVFFLALAGCVQATKPVVPFADQTTATDVASAVRYSNFVKPCEQLPVVPVQATDVETVIKLYVELEGQYNACAIKDDCLIAVVMNYGTCGPAAYAGKPLSFGAPDDRQP